MSCPSLFGSGVRGALSRCSILITVLLLTPVSGVGAQHHADEHEILDFSHPLVTESPTPDTKFRLDYVRTRVGDAVNLTENAFRLEGEYALNHSVSVAIVTPFVSRTAPSQHVSGLGNVELSIKAASLALGAHGFLFGGGLSTELPTGSDAKGIGSSHLVALEPFFDVAYKQNALELVGFTTISSTFHRRAGEGAERSLAFDFSTLYQLHPRLEGLLELTTARALADADRGEETFVAPGVKVYPFSNRHIMFGASLEFGTGNVDSTRVFLVSGFYHF
jgi:hypothetical protein